MNGPRILEKLTYSVTSPTTKTAGYAGFSSRFGMR
jgi:hypothetical protein